MTQLSSGYDPQEVEARWYSFWQTRGYFVPDSDPSKPPFTVVLPPPNVTGRLHMGHALTATIEDCLVRWKRMSGFAALWLPGTDHAGIATQVMVERQLQKEGTSREQLGRAAFLERVWQWKEAHGGVIDEQHKRLGASLEWSRYRFTMDARSSKAVREAFCRLYEQGLVYRAHRLISWDWQSQTALSDLEVEHREVDGHLWHISYPVEGSDESLVVATTRPETMLGDTAVAVHPDDPRHRHLIGKFVVLPLVGRRIPIVGDAVLVDMEFGTGAVKVTPAHDFNDFATGQRHGLELVCVIGLDGRINDQAPAEFRGLSVDAARVRVVEALERAARLIKVEAHKMNVGFSQRNADVRVEPLPSTQWFLDVQPMAKRALAAVHAGETHFVPAHRTADFHRWMENIHDWCISRQLWWGHRIPAWYCDACEHITVAREDVRQCERCASASVRQDEDVLDTWFSSGLWPLTTLGWPDQSDDLARFYPTQLMETGWDILFFWVARMMMFGLHFTGKVPFSTVFLHSMVLGEDGQKMSKTKGNVVDPVDLVESFGADSLRYYLCTMAGQDAGIVFARARVEGYRHFCNKLWNATRFALMNLDGFQSQGGALQCASLSAADRWIVARVGRVASEVEAHLHEFRLDLAAHKLYQFVWYELCDWYLELAKPSLREAGEAQLAVRETLVTVFDATLRLLHPMMPFITEELWSRLPHAEDQRLESLMMADYPYRRAPADPTTSSWCGPLQGFAAWSQQPEVRRSCDDIELLMPLVTAIRGLRAQFKLPPTQPVAVLLRSEDGGTAKALERLLPSLAHLARLGEPPRVLRATDEIPREAGLELVRGVEVVLPLSGLVDLGAERERLGKDHAALTREIDALRKRLHNPGFRAKAPPEVVAKDDARLEQLQLDVQKITATIARLGGNE